MAVVFYESEGLRVVQTAFVVARRTSLFAQIDGMREVGADRGHEPEGACVRWEAEPD